MANNTGDWEQHEGDVSMPPEAVGYNKGWDAGIKQARAEVLAACQNVVEVFIQEIGKFSLEFARWRPFKKWDQDDWEAAGLRLLTDVQDAMEKVQPAASDLEALLEEARREAELKGLRMECTGMRMHKIYDTAGKVLCPACDRMLKLEKARVREDNK